MSACEASMSLFYFSREKNKYLDVFCCSAKCLIKRKKKNRLVEFSSKF